MPRNYTYHEEIKIMMAEVFRNGTMTDSEWTYKYELLKKNTPLEAMGELMESIMKNGYSLEESSKVVKELLVEAKRKIEIKEL